MHGSSGVPPFASIPVERTIGARAHQRAHVVRPWHARESLIENVAGDPFSDVQRCVEDVTLRRVEACPCGSLLALRACDLARLTNYHFHASPPGLMAD